jgi:hypothetical protein
VELHTSDRSASNGEQHRKDDRFPVGPIIPDGRRKTPNHVATRKVCQHRTPGIESCKHKVVEASNAGSWPGLRRQVGIVHPESDGEVHGSRWIFDWQKAFACGLQEWLAIRGQSANGAGSRVKLTQRVSRRPGRESLLRLKPDSTNA